MKKVMIILLTMALCLNLMACGSGWVEYDYSYPEEKFRAEQMIRIADDDDFASYFACKVWARKRTMGIVLPGAKQEYFEGYIARLDDFDNVYIFLFEIKGDYEQGDYTKCKIIDFNETPDGEFSEADNCLGHYRIDKIRIKKRT